MVSQGSGAGKQWRSVQLGLLLRNGESVEKDLVKAVKWYRKAAEQGESTLGYCYEHGRGVKKDLVKTAEWDRKSKDDN